MLGRFPQTKTVTKENQAVNLDDLGPRICMLGPSNSGKSTLATAIGQAQTIPVVHLDQLRHLPGTQWELRPNDEFAGLHNAAIRRDRWILEGNYSKLLPQRLERATSLVLLDSSAAASLFRYARRTLSTRNRIGGLEGTKERITWSMIRFILGPGQTNKHRYRRVFEETGLPKIYLPDRHALNLFYRQHKIQI